MLGFDVEPDRHSPCSPDACCSWTLPVAEALILVRKISARVASCYSQILVESEETVKSALDLGEAGEGNNPR